MQLNETADRGGKVREILCDCCSKELTYDSCYAIPSIDPESEKGLDRLKEWIDAMQGRISRIVCKEDFDDYLDIVANKQAKHGNVTLCDIPDPLLEKAYSTAKQRAQSYLDGNISGLPVKQLSVPETHARPKRFAKTAEDLTSKGFALAKNGKYENALRKFKKALKKDPASVEALYGKGAVYLKQSFFKSAKKCFSRVIEMDPDHKKSMLFLQKCDEMIQERQNSLAISESSKSASSSAEIASEMGTTNKGWTYLNFKSVEYSKDFLLGSNISVYFNTSESHTGCYNDAEFLSWRIKRILLYVGSSILVFAIPFLPFLGSPEFFAGLPCIACTFVFALLGIMLLSIAGNNREAFEKKWMLKNAHIQRGESKDDASLLVVKDGEWDSFVMNYTLGQYAWIIKKH